MYVFKTATSSIEDLPKSPLRASDISWAEIDRDMDRARMLRGRFVAHCFRHLGQICVGRCRQLAERPFAPLSSLHLPSRHRLFS